MSGTVREDYHSEQADYLATHAKQPGTPATKVMFALLSVGERIAELTQEIRRGNEARL